MKSTRFGKRSRNWVLSVLLPAFAFSGQPLRANPQVSLPTGGQVIHGQAFINQISANHLRIDQSSQNAIISWTDFSIAQGNLTQFAQPNASASVLNRVTGGNVSHIHGMLQGNGNVFVINPNGIVIGASGVVDVGGMAVLSTLDIDDQDFLDGGPSRFYGDSTTGVSNFGTITSAGGDVVLLGGFVNNEGQIGAMNGTVALGSGGDILLEQSNGAQITVRGASDYDGRPGDYNKTGAGINNAGEIGGAAVEMKAHGNVYALAINNTGMVRASGATRANGRVRLQAGGGSSNINLGNTSQLYARNGADGGEIRVESVGGNVTNAGAIDASGAVDGGTVEVVGNTVTTTASSVVSATGVDEGGMIQIDAVAATTVSGLVDASSSFGTGGRVEITGAEVELTGVTEVTVDGAREGGGLRIGGEFQGRDDFGIREADFTTIGGEVILTADSRFGDAGSVIVWANEDTMYLGEASASALGPIGNGGLIEISGKERLAMRGNVAAYSVGGASGTVLFDPGTLTVGNFGGNSTSFNEIEIADINKILQGGTSVLLMTSGAGSDIIFADVDLPGMNAGGSQTQGALVGIGVNAGVPFDDPNHPRNLSVQWTNSDASFGAFAGGSIILNNHIRTSGEGSINLIAGWTGLETDNALSSYVPGGSGLSENGSIIGLNGPQDLFRTYVAAGQFGENGGFIRVGEKSMDRHVEVGSRYGDTNLAAFDIIIEAADNFNNESLHAQVGFRDAGMVFAPRFDNAVNALDFDLTDSDGNRYNFDAVERITGFAEDGETRFLLDNPGSFTVGQKVEINGVRTDLSARTWIVSEVNTVDGYITVEDLGGSLLTGANTTGNNADWNNRPDEVRAFKDDKVLVAMAGNAFGQEVDINGDGLVDGVRAIDETGVLGDTFISYSNHFNSARVGNWWWQQIQAEAELNFSNYGYADATAAAADRGGNRPEMGAGSVTSGADINVIAKGNVEVRGGGRTNSGAYIGHGGDSGGWADHFSMRDERLLNGQTPYYYTISGASNSRSAISIGRLAGVYGNINVLAGVDEVSAIDAQGVVEATFTDRGNVILEGLQRMGASNDPTNEENGAGARAMVLVGHGGIGQFGVFEGDITVEAGGGVSVKAGSQTGSSAVIGHNVTNFAYWNPTDNVDQQIRFFSSAEDFDDPLLRRGVLFSTEPTNISQDEDGDRFSGTRPRALSPRLSTRPGVVIEALDGSVVKGFHGNINVTAHNGDIDVIGYSTPDRSDGTVTPGVDDATAFNGLRTNRDRRFAMIGHGGSTDSTWSEGSGYVPVGPNRNIELVQFRTPNGDSGSASVIGESGAGRNRALTFMTITGDIDVNASGDLVLEGGNDFYAFAQVGHGGAEVADFETSSFINGNIDVNVGGKMDLRGGGEVMYTGDANNRRIRAYSMIGHGGYTSGFMGFYGNIDVNAGGPITMTGGKYDFTFAKIGHQGGDDNGQVGGDFLRNENFDFDSAVTDIEVNITGGTATVGYTAAPGNLTGLTMAPRIFNDIKTTNVSVTSGGGITMNHLGEGVGFNDNQDFLNRNRANTLNMINIAPVQIGHGGNGTAGLNRGNPENDFANKIGDITVVANGGDIRLENGNGDQRWTRIGHGVGRNDRGDFGGNSMEFTGDIRVEASGSVILDAAAADSYGLEVNADSESTPRNELGIGDPSRWNPVAIGHGGAYDNYGLIVINDGQVSGVDASADITVVAGADIEVHGGVGKEGTSAQIGHGFSVFLGNSNNNRKNDVPNGFAGDINVSAGRDLTVTGGDLAFLLEPLLTEDQAISIVGAFGTIGHGGFGVDAQAHGDIQVYVGRDLLVEAQQRTQAAATSFSSGGSYVYTPPTDTGQSSNVASLFNFAKIGHSNAENGNAVGGLGDAIINADQSGDITVVVNRNFNMVGGTTTDESGAPIVGAFAQVGHGGPGIAGDSFEGDITVLVKNNLTTTGGTIAQDSLVSLNNYAMIGNGDRVAQDPGVGTASVFYGESLGDRIGDITIAVGNSASFTSTLIGHSDPAISLQSTVGNTQVAVSRNNPFFGGGGTLTSTGSVFSSGNSGTVGNDRLEFYMPGRSSNLIDSNTRLNEFSALYSSGTPGNFVGLDGSGSETSGRADEVYLTPDLWWDAAGFGEANGFAGGGVFPTDAASGQGGAVAEVDTPGGFPNLTALAAGALGSSASTYRQGNGVNGAGNYTFYYDAVEPVAAPSLPGPPPPVPPVFAPFPFLDFLFEEQFDSFDRYQEFLANGLTGDGTGIYGALGIFETDALESGEAGATRLENRLDNLVGSRRNSFSEEELAEEEEARRRRSEKGVGSIGLTYYVFDPGTNRYSSYRVFGTAFDQFYPVN